MCRFSEIRGHPWVGLACSQHVGRGREDRVLPWEEVASLPRDPLWGPRVTWGPRVGTEEPSQGWAEGAPEPQARAGQSSRRGSSRGRRCRERGWGGGGCHVPRWALGGEKTWPPAMAKSRAACWTLSPCESVLAVGPGTPAGVCSGLPGRTGLPDPSKGGGWLPVTHQHWSQRGRIPEPPGQAVCQGTPTCSQL